MLRPRRTHSGCAWRTRVNNMTGSIRAPAPAARSVTGGSAVSACRPAGPAGCGLRARRSGHGGRGDPQFDTVEQAPETHPEVLVQRMLLGPAVAQVGGVEEHR